MTPDDAGPASDGSPGATAPEALSVLVAGDGCEPDRLLMLARPRAGRVKVREWSTQSWNSEPREHEADVDALWQAFERAYRQRRRLSEALPRIRAWLDGRG